MKVTIGIPNYNGIEYLKKCLDSLKADLEKCPAHVIVVDNGSSDGSAAWVSEHFPEVELLALTENTGFCRAVNLGIRTAQTPYVILLNNDTEVIEGFTKALLDAIETSDKIFSVSAKMLDMKDETLLDNAGDLYCALGWAYARGKGKQADLYQTRVKVFSSCGGAAIYRKNVFEEIGYFDENHFAYLEDVDIGWRAGIFGYENYFEPGAAVLHAGSAASGSRYNLFKVNLASANSVYIIGKNMPFLQWLINLPLLFVGFMVKAFFFTLKGMGPAYVKGCFRGFVRCFKKEGREHKIGFMWKNLKNYCKIQWDLWVNLFRRLAN